MKHKDKINWMIQYAHNNKVRLELEGECGLFRECVGILADNGNYPDYEWHDEETYKRIDNNGKVFTPKDAYHKHPCVSVLGRGKEAESQLYEWLKWFDDNCFIVETGIHDWKEKEYDDLDLILGKHEYARMVKK